jgi:hypothetical protein
MYFVTKIAEQVRDRVQTTLAVSRERRRGPVL